MAVNFRELLNVTSSDVDKERPKTLPVGHYIGKISGYEFGLSRQKQTPYIRFFLAPEEATGDVDGDRLTDLDLSKQQVRKDFYITPKARYRLSDMLDAVLGRDDRILDERIADTRGARVMFGVTERPSESGEDTYNDVTTVVAAPEGAASAAA